MLVDLYHKDALIVATRTAERAVAFMVGSPLSIDSEGGVPNVDTTVDLVRNEIKEKIPTEISRFEDAIRGKTGADIYQVAMAWLNANINQNAVNRVVKRAVTQAWKSSNQGAALADDTDGEPEDWHIPAGTKSLAKLVCLGHRLFKGPILTTNFDPLLSLAVRSLGKRPRRSVIDYDGALSGPADEEPDDRSIVHLHGYWRLSDTLHTQSQLRSPRPKLKASLQSLLRQRTLIVVAYSGWDDAFTDALAEVLNDRHAELDVLWCFHENDGASVCARYERLLDRVSPAIGRGRFRAYGGIDCHSIFFEIENAIRIDLSPPEPKGLICRVENPLLEDLQREIEVGSVIAIIGAGVSIGATNNKPVASWRGLLHHGVDHCHELKSMTGVDEKWAERVHAEIDSIDLDDMLSAAEKISRKLGAPGGGEYRRWLRETIYELKAERRDVLEALRDLKVALATTNYDGLIEEVTNLPAVTWMDGAKVERVVRGDEPGVVHLHGYWDRPESVILGIRSYEKVLGDAHAQTMQRAIRSLKTLLFVGCREGLLDPNFGALLEWSAKVLAGSEYRHFLLTRESEVAALQSQRLLGEGIVVLSYGKDFGDLAPFLRGLRAGRATRQKAQTGSPAQLFGPPGIAVAAPAMSTGTVQSFDVFLSYSDEEVTIVELLAKKLTDKGPFRVWLDKWILVPGKLRRQDGDNGLDQAKSCAVCIGRQTPKVWFRQEIARARNRQAKDESFRVMAVILPNGESSFRYDFAELRTTSWVDFSKGLGDDYALHVLACGIKGIPPGSYTPPVERKTTIDPLAVKLEKIQTLRLKQLITEAISEEYQRKLLDEDLQQLTSNG